jgi:integrase
LDDLTLEDARKKADEWRALIRRGIDPREHEESERKAQAKKRDNTFEAVVEAYISDIPTRKRNRHAEQDAREIRRELLYRKDKAGNETWRNEWASKSIAEITDEHIAELISEIRDRPAPGMAYNTWGHVKAIFTWAMQPKRRRGFGLTENPVRNLQPKNFELSKTISTRVLDDDELTAYWAAADEMPYPLGPFFKLLMLTGQRKSEVAGARWSEIDIARKLWTVPPDRFKSGQSHIVPLSDDALALIQSLPHFVGKDAGDCLFSTMNGLKPINGFSKAKASLDEALLSELRKQKPGVQLRDWVLHDVRRTVRTRLSGLKVNADVAELVIGHAKKGMLRVYDQYEFESEMREALELWAKRLRDILNPPPANVVTLDRARA